MIDHEAEFTFRVLLSILEVIVEFHLVTLYQDELSAHRKESGRGRNFYLRILTTGKGLPCFSNMLGVILGTILIVLSGNKEADLFTWSALDITSVISL